MLVVALMSDAPAAEANWQSANPAARPALLFSRSLKGSHKNVSRDAVQRAMRWMPFVRISHHVILRVSLKSKGFSRRSEKYCL